MALTSKEKQAVSTYRIAKGDTLSGIAKKHNTTVSALAKANNIKNVNRISAGATLKIGSSPIKAKQTVVKKPVVTSKKATTTKTTAKKTTTATKTPAKIVEKPKVLTQYEKEQQSQQGNYNSPYNIQQRQEQMGQEGLTSVEALLREGAKASMDGQTAQLGHARDQQIADLQAGYEQAVADGQISVREAEQQFQAQVDEINQQAYVDAQNTNLAGQERGIQNSMQYLGLMQGDQARANQGKQSAMSQRDAQILSIQDRLKALDAQRGRDITNANANYDYGIAGAQAQSDAQVASQLAQMTQDNNMLNRQQGFALDQGALNHDYAKADAKVAQQYQLDTLRKQQEYGYKNMKIQNGYQLQQMATAFGYDVKKMDKQAQIDFAKMAKQAGYDVDMAVLQQGFTQDNMATQQGYTQQNMATQQQFDMNKMYQANEFDVAGDKRKFEYAQKEAKANSALRIKEETALYDKAVERELAKYTKGTPEYDIRKSQLADQREAMVQEIVTKAQTEAVINNNLGTPIPKPTNPGTKRSFWETQGHQDKEEKQYKIDLARYNAYQKALKDPMSLFPND